MCGIRYRSIAHEHSEGDDPRDLDGVKAAEALGDAIHFAKIAYGEDHDITAQMLTWIREGTNWDELNLK